MTSKRGMSGTVFGAIVVLLASAVPAQAAPAFSSPHYVHATGTSLYPVAVGDLNKDGHQDIVVGSEDNKTVSILYGKKGGGFHSPEDHPGGSYPFWISLGDFNRDRRLDIAVADDEDPGTVTVLLSRRGGFRSPDTYDVGADPFAIAVADFNGDGNKDLAVANESDDSFSILLGRRDGNFHDAVTHPAGSVPVAIIAANLNGDGKKDLAVLNYDTGAADVMVFEGKGDGTFRAPDDFPAGATQPEGMVAGQFTGDRNLDLAVPDCEATPNYVYLLAGNGTGGFHSPRHFTNDPGSCSYRSAVADLNRDGHPDLVTAIDAGTNDGKVSVLYGQKHGRFSSPKLFDATGAHDNYSIATGLLNGDRVRDLVVPDYEAQRVAILLGRG